MTTKKESTYLDNVKSVKAHGIEGSDTKADVILKGDGIAKNGGFRFNGKGRDSIFLFVNGNVKIGENVAEMASVTLKKVMLKVSTSNGIMPYMVKKSDLTKSVWTEIAKACGKKAKSAKTAKTPKKAKKAETPETANEVKMAQNAKIAELAKKGTMAELT